MWSSTEDMERTMDYIHHYHGTPGKFLGPTPDEWHIITKPVAFPSGTKKDNWRRFVADVDRLHCYSYFWKSPMPTGATHKIALFTTWTKSWVGTTSGAWVDQPWHAWVGISVKLPAGEGYELIIWDSNFEAENGHHKIPTGLGTQRNLVEQMRKSVKLVRVWVGGSGNTAEGNCLQLSAQWIWDILDKKRILLPPPGDAGAYAGAGFQLAGKPYAAPTPPEMPSPGETEDEEGTEEETGDEGSQPDTPEAPTAPEAPATPEVAATPEVPATPALPATLGAVATPERPATQVKQVTPLGPVHYPIRTREEETEEEEEKDEGYTSNEELTDEELQSQLMNDMAETPPEWDGFSEWEGFSDNEGDDVEGEEDEVVEEEE